MLFLVEDFMRLFQTQTSKQNYFLVLISEIIIDIVSSVCYFLLIQEFNDFIQKVSVIKSHDLVPFSALKGLRILYAFTSFKSWIHYRILLDAINHSISSVLNIMLIAFSFMYLGTIIGMWLFGGKLKFDELGMLDLAKGYSLFNHFLNHKKIFYSHNI